MKKTLFALLAAVSITAVAQEKQLISSAIIAIDNRNDLPEAKKYIDQATEIMNGKGGVSTDPKVTSKYYYYNGLIYLRIYSSEDPKIKEMAPNGVDVASESFVKLLNFEQSQPKKYYTEDVVMQMPYISGMLKNQAYDRNDAGEYVAAAGYFMKAYDLQRNPALGQYASIDTLTYYYAALTYNTAKMYPEATSILKEVLEMGYDGFSYTATSVASDKPLRYATKADMDRQVAQGIAKDPVIGASERPNVYKSLLAIYIETKDTENFNIYLKKARAEFPSDVALINLELQGYIDTKEYDKALEILAVAIEKDPSNPVYYYVRGFLYQTNIKDNDKALASYAKATELKPDYFDAYFMAGVVWYDQGKAVLEEMNKLGMSSADQKKYEQLAKVKTEKFEKSVPFFEKAHELDKADAETIKALYEVYRQLKQNEKALEMKKLLDGMTK